MTRNLIVAACLISSSLLTPSPAESATLLQWLFPRLASRRVSRTVYAPAAINYAPYAATTANYGGGCSTCSSQQTGWYYKPQTNYRTVWSPVPVTTYRPTGGVYTGIQPSTAYDWQARRVPYVSYRPIFAGFNRPYSSLYGSTTTVAPNAGNYWTQFGTAGYRLPTTRTRAAVQPQAFGYSSPADFAPVLTAPAVTAAPAPTTAYSIPTYPATTTYSPITTRYPSAWEPVTTTASPVVGATEWAPVDSARTTYTAPTTSNYAPHDAYSNNGSSSHSGHSHAGEASGATPWMPLDEYNRSRNRIDPRDGRDRDLQSVPADSRPRLEDNNYRQRDSFYDRDRRDDSNSDDRDARWRAYDQYGYGNPAHRHRESAHRHHDPSHDVNYDRHSPSRHPATRTVPYDRPIPDVDREPSRFETRKETDSDRRLLSAPEITAALDKATSRWRAEPLRPSGRQCVGCTKRTEVRRPSRDQSGWRPAL